MVRYAKTILATALLLASFYPTKTTEARPSTSYFELIANKHNLNPLILEGVCHYESGFGRGKEHHNKNGSWDVGYCQNHRGKSEVRTASIPSDRASIREAAQELVYWKKQHLRFCVQLLEETGSCGRVVYGKWRGVKNCHRPHPYFAHYNWGFRVLKNNYGKKVQCFINSGFKKCKSTEWEKISF